MNNILKKYEIRFYNKKVSGLLYKVCESSLKEFEPVTNFLFEYAKNYKRLLIELPNFINEVKKGVKPPAFEAGESSLIKVEVDKIKFWIIGTSAPQLNNPEYEMNNDDFKKILKEWLKFINK